jgi:hypothetical protein
MGIPKVAFNSRSTSKPPYKKLSNSYDYISEKVKIAVAQISSKDPYTKMIDGRSVR